MIRICLSAVLAVRDGYTGKPITESTVRCFLNGQPFRPQYRAGGYLVFVNLAPGEYEALLQGAYYQDERVAFVVAQGEKAQECSVTLKPAANYPFYNAVTQLCAVILERGKPVCGRTVWVAAKAQAEELKLAQDMAQPGDTGAKLYFRGGAQGRFPRNYLVVDGKNSEIVPIAGAQDGQAVFDAPLRNAHKRGTALYPAQAYRTGQEGEILAFFREPVPVELFDPEKNTLAGLQLEQGRNEMRLGK